MAQASGVASMVGGGFAEFEIALSAWTNDLYSNIDYTYGGITSDINQINTIIFNDPNNQISGSYDCNAGGILAIGIWWSKDVHSYNGTTYNSIVKGSIVTQDGAGCFFSGNNSKNGEEVFANELGHTLGIDHSSDSDALMYAMAHGDGQGAELSWMTEMRLIFYINIHLSLQLFQMPLWSVQMRQRVKSLLTGLMWQLPLPTNCFVQR